MVASLAPGCDFLSPDPGQGSRTKGQGGAVRKGKEAPMLAELVKNGELPPVEERLPSKPVVVEPTNIVGRYGGTLRGISLAPETTSDLQTTMTPSLFRFSQDLSEQYPEVAEGYEFNDDYTVCTIRLREGIK
jgi:peptide/nickel transport system substrate-binding protein